jgi:hypothetical protein
MEDIKKFENYNIQDMMSIPTSLINQSNNKKINNKLNDEIDPLDEEYYIEKLYPYYNFIKKIKQANCISQITYEMYDDFIGFLFFIYDNPYEILFCKKDNKIYLKKDEDFLEIKNSSDILKIINT